MKKEMLEQLKNELKKSEVVKYGDKTFNVSNLAMKDINNISDMNDNERMNYVLSNCTDVEDPDLITISEAEFLYLKIKGLSNDVIKSEEFTCNECGELVSSDVSLNEIHLPEELDNSFEFGQMTIYMRHPVLGELKLFNDGETQSELLNLTIRCVDKIMLNGSIVSDLSIEERVEVLDYLDAPSFIKLVEYIQNPARPLVMLNLSCKCGATDSVALHGAEEILSG
ncbi:T4 family baseplate hub assembly chaperone [Vibrio bivalvicida]|uniref:Baseplate protein n=1 Tax=Vibrio bivalvicida TaxID=1276888 RepID=A0A177XV02_9VIBR|nr:hypothetical protein [Vibrio bivalvicida]OAJ92432.1 hypothetical protein APB76_20780 [Vibrio bivalvicida]